MENKDFLSDFLEDMGNEPFGAEDSTEVFATAEEQKTTQTVQTTEKPSETIPQNLPRENAPTKTETPAVNTEAEKITPANSEPPKESVSVQAEQQILGDPFEEALKKSEEKSKERLIGTLAEKNPVFKYASVNEPITDKEITFEDLRTKYETDFPELEEKANISWTVTYGKTSESISNPSKEKIFAVKEKIEKSDKFIADLKKAKKDEDKNPECVVKPFVKAQKKGDALAMPDYKGFYLDYEEALQSHKVIAFVPARDGQIYEIRKNPIGIFQSPSRAIGGFADIKTKFSLSLPEIPMFLLYQVISFFREISRKHTLEVLVHLVYDTQAEKYNVTVPKQKVTNVSVKAETEEYPEHIVHVMDIHSHNVMAAKFSGIDDKDEKVTRLYGVIGRLDKMLPDIALRASNGGKFIELKSDEIFDLEATYPEEWFDNLDHMMAEAICEVSVKSMDCSKPVIAGGGGAFPLIFQPEQKLLNQSMGNLLQSQLLRR